MILQNHTTSVEASGARKQINKWKFLICVEYVTFHANRIEHLVAQSGENVRSYMFLKPAKFGSKVINRTEASDLFHSCWNDQSYFFRFILGYFPG